jgi:anaerobic magnesium-protoporphyrin IX monomethyl ester cyclase
MNVEKPVILIAPPPSDPTQPYSSLPTLTGFLRKKGFEVIQIDLGLRLFDEWMAPEKLEKARDEASSLLNFSTSTINDRYLERYFGIIGFADYIISHVEEAKGIMRDTVEFYDLKKYDWASSVLKIACELVSLPSFPTEFKPYDYAVHVNMTFRNLQEATSQRSENLFYDAFSKGAVPEILSLDPLLVGISITYNFQIIPALTLARLLKKASPGLHVCIGGAAISTLELQIMEESSWFEYADSYVIGEGETALFSLANNILENKDLRLGPNIIVCKEGKPTTGERWRCEEIDELPSPDFSGLELNRYLIPEPVFLIESTRGCYHGKCAFCNVSMNKKRRYRSNAPGRTASLMREFFNRYGVKRFFLCDDAIPIANMLEIANFVIEESPSVTWAGEARFEVNLSQSIGFLKQGGCRQLIFGLESVSQRVLDLMDKRNTVENDLRILKACNDAGLAVNLQTFIGFPTETREEACKTIDFIAASEGSIISYGFCKFDLCRDTPVFENPNNYGITIHPIPKDGSYLANIEFEQSSGMSREETESVYNEGLTRLEKIYSGRTNYLCRTAGAHVLLHLSHYGWNELIEYWKKNEENHPLKKALAYDAVVQINPAIILSHPFELMHSVEHRALNTETGRQYSLSSEEQRLLEFCVNPINVREALDRWVKAMRKDNEGRVLNLAKAAIIINKLYMNYIIKKQ